MRRLDHQESSVDELRSRSGTLLAAAALATSFLGSAAFPDGQPWTTPAWRFVNDPTKVIGDYLEGEPPAGVAEIHRELALHAECNATHSDKKLRWLYAAFAAAAFGLLVQVLAWLTVILGGLPGD